MYRQPQLDAPIVVCAYPGRIAARDLRTGHLAWEFRFIQQGGSGTSRVLVDNGRVFAMSYILGPAPQSIFGTQTNPAVVAALDYLTGAHIWSVQIDHMMTSATMLIVGDLLVVADGNYVATLHTHSGAVLWREEDGQEFEQDGMRKRYAIGLAVPGHAQQADRG